MIKSLRLDEPMEMTFEITDVDMKILQEALCDINIKECPWFEIQDKHGNRAKYYREQRWIPCSERLPDEHEWIGTKKFGTTISNEVYVTFENPKGERFCEHLSFQNGKLSGFDQSTIDAFHKGSKPIAWMPLPEPYKGEGS